MPLVAAVLVGACSTRTPAARVYVSNEDDGTISVIDGRSLDVVATIRVGKRPRGLRVAPDGRRLYVALSGSPKAGPHVDRRTLPPADRAADGIGVIDLATLTLLQVLPSGQDPEAFDLLPGGQRLVVSNEETGEASVIDLGTGAIVARLPVGGEPEGVTVGPDGLAYVTSEEDDRVTALDGMKQRVAWHLPTGRRPRAIAILGDGSEAFVTNELGASVTVLDLGRRSVAATIALPREGSGPLGPLPMGIAVARDQRTLFVANGRGGSVSVIDARRRTVVKTIAAVGVRPWGIAIAPDGRVFTANGPGNDVSVIDATSGTVIRRVPVGHAPWGVAIHP